MKQLKRLTRKQKKLLSENNFNCNNYLEERNLTEGTMFVDRLRTHRLYYCLDEEKFYRLGV